MSDSELEILEIISSVGQTRSLYIGAIQEAKGKNYGQCNEFVRKGNEQYVEGHRIRQRLVQEEAGGNPVDLNFLLTHAQDLLMGAESFKILCDEFVDLYCKFDELEEKMYGREQRHGVISVFFCLRKRHDL